MDPEDFGKEAARAFLASMREAGHEAQHLLGSPVDSSPVYLGPRLAERGVIMSYCCITLFLVVNPAQPDGL